jgi:transposase-like protein
MVAFRAMASIAGKASETLRKWAGGAERHGGQRACQTSSECDQLRRLAREERKLQRAKEMLRTANCLFPRRSSTASGRGGAVVRKSMQRFWGEDVSGCLSCKLWRRLRWEWLYVARCTVLPLAKWNDLACAAQSVNCHSVESLPSVGYKWYGVGQNASRAV